MINLPTDLLRTFVTIAELGGFSRAANALGRSQPAISLQIKRLESLTGESLLTRRGRQLEPTEQGKLLLDYARQILALNDQAVEEILQPRLAGHVRLGIPNEFAISVLPSILANFSQSYPDVTLEVTCDLSTNLLNLIEKGDMDIAIAIHDQPISKPTHTTWQETLVWVAADTRMLEADATIPLIVAPQGCVYRKRMIDTLTRLKRQWRIIYTSASYGGIRAAALAGLGVTALARSTMPAGLRVLGEDEHFPPLEPTDVALHIHPHSRGDAPLRLADHISASIVSNNHWDLQL